MRFLIRRYHHPPLARAWDLAGVARSVFEAAGISFTRREHWYESELVDDIPPEFRGAMQVETVAIGSAFEGETSPQTPSVLAEPDPMLVESVRIPTVGKGDSASPAKPPHSETSASEPGGQDVEDETVELSVPKTEVEVRAKANRRGGK